MTMRQDYEKLSIEEFGAGLLETGDLDPVYEALAHLEDIPRQQLYRWLVAYWCFYNAGVASWLSEREGREFWDAMMVAARNESPAPPGGRWPRAKERRHFRGGSCTRAVAELRDRYGDLPSDMLEYIAEAAPDYQAVARRVQEHRLFGPWIAFKVADMLERVCDVHIDFTEAAVFMFKDPTQAALMLWQQQSGYDPLRKDVRIKDRQRAVTSVVEYLLDHFKGHDAPPGGRKVNLQEVETILCKWKSHLRGHYPIGNDVYEVREGTDPWIMYSDTAREFLRGMAVPTSQMQVEVSGE